MNKFTTRILTVIGAALFFVTNFTFNTVQAEELVLAADGESRAPIVIFENPPPKTARAAEELSEYIEKISGAQPEILEGRPDPIPESALWVGYQPVLDELFPDTDLDFYEAEEIVIAANEKHLVIAGRDRWNDDHLIVEGRNRTINGVQQEYGTVNAVYTFLQDYLDVRWLWPGETGIDIIERRKISFNPFEYRYHPQFRQRAGLFRLSTLGDSRGLAQDWTRFQRLQLDSLRRRVGGGHRFVRWWDKYHEEHPEYFALQPDGTRSGFPGPTLAKLCVSNPGVWDRWIEEMGKMIEADPNQNVFGSGQNDSWNRGHCICEDCRAWDHLEAERRRHAWEGVAQDYLAMSDRYIKFANKLAAKVKEHYPDGDYYVSASAYGHTRPAPVEVKPADNIIISSVANFLMRSGATDRGSPHNTPHREQFAAWGKVADKVIWRPNVGNPAGWQQGMISVLINQASEDFKFAAENNAIGIFVDTVWEHWATHGPLYYVMGHLAWDPYQDVQALLDDYYQRGFGPAARQIEDFWTLMEEVSVEIVEGRIGGWTEAEEELARAGEILDEAGERISDAPEIFAERLAFVRAAYDYTRLMSESRRLMDIADDTPEAADKIRANTERIRQIQEDFPHAFNGQVRPGQHRVSSYHLDD